MIFCVSTLSIREGVAGGCSLAWMEIRFIRAAILLSRSLCFFGQKVDSPHKFGVLLRPWFQLNIFCRCGTSLLCGMQFLTTMDLKTGGHREHVSPLFTNSYIKYPYLGYIAALLHARVPIECMCPSLFE